MKIYEIGTGYTPIPAQIGAATEIVAEELSRAFLELDLPVQIIDIKAKNRTKTDLPIREVWVPGCFSGTDIKLGLMHKLKRVVYSLCLCATLQKILRQERERVILHFHNQYNLFFFLLLTPRALRKKALIAYTVHSGIWRQSWEKIESAVKRRYFQEMCCVKNADLVFVLNQETARNLQTHLNVERNRIRSIANGIHEEVYYPMGQKRKPMVLQVGSVCENKGQLRAVQLLLPLLRKHPDLHYAYAGGIVEETYHEKLRKFAEEQGVEKQICYLGMIAPGKALNEVYGSALCTIFPSGYEAFGLVAVESLATGTPVLLERTGVMNFGEGCMFYTSENFEEIVETLLQDDQTLLRQLARRNAAENFSWRKIAVDYAAAFEEGMGIR